MALLKTAFVEFPPCPGALGYSGPCGSYLGTYLSCCRTVGSDSRTAASALCLGSSHEHLIAAMPAWAVFFKEMNCLLYHIASSIIVSIIERETA